MAASYEPGEEIRLQLDGSKRAFYSKAKSWREQKNLGIQSDEIKKIEDEQDQVDEMLAVLAEQITRTDPPIKITAETLADVLDYRSIWVLFASIRYNLTADEKKSSE